MRKNKNLEINKNGYKGFIKIKDFENKYKEIPQRKGIYKILRKNCSSPKFLKQSTAGHFKGKNPAVTVTILKNKWLPKIQIVYIGKAGGNQKTTLRKRIRNYIEFGKGKSRPHWGGRYIWQLKDAKELVVCWQETKNDPREIEKEMLKEFKDEFGKLPFANLTM